jgi:hypothetical protein
MFRDVLFLPVQELDDAVSSRLLGIAGERLTAGPGPRPGRFKDWDMDSMVRTPTL